MDILDIITTILGLLYIYLEYKAKIGLWVIGIIMPALDIFLYWNHGLYGDSALAVYYLLAALYGYIKWSRGEIKADLPISRMPLRLYPPAILFFFVAWGATYWILDNYTNSTVPVLDGFTNALSIVGMWALARKFVEQWIFWIIVDVVCTYLYIIKGIPFKAGLYGLYIIIAVAGYRKWKNLISDGSELPLTPANSLNK